MTNQNSTASPSTSITAVASAVVAVLPSTLVPAPFVALQPSYMLQLPTALWRTPELSHQIGALDRKTKRFKNIPVSSVAEAVSRALSLSNSGDDVYIALAGYLTPNNRTAANVSGAHAFWADVDCGDEKAAAEKGYKNEEEALAKLLEFCKRAGLPVPTFIVSSGGGLHVYWVLKTFITRENWQAYAVKLKALTHALGFLADDTRTADIASVLRFPGTRNFKYDPPRPVTLKQASTEYIEQSVFFEAIDSAHLRLCQPVIKATMHDAPPRISGKSQGSSVGKLDALLGYISPDCGYQNWLNVLMAIYHETGGSEDGFHLALGWSSTGATFKDSKEIRVKWASFKSGRDNPITIATLIKMAKGNGMDSLADSDAFELFETEVVRSGLQSAKPAVAAVNPLTKYSLLDMSAEVEKQTVAQVRILGEIALMGQSTMIYASPNTGKTLITLFLLIEGIKQGRIDPSLLYYLNMDDSGPGLLVKLRMAEEYRFHMLAEGYREFKIADFLSIIVDMVEKDKARGVIIVLDTLKKFVDVMDKSKGSSFGKVVRRFIIKGGTLIALAHTNKNPGGNGKPKFGGTSDIVDDCDCAYTLAPVSSESGTKVVEFENFKRRGDVAQTAAYSYTCENGASYNEILLSVTRVADDLIEPIKQAEQLRSDAEVITAVTSCINEGVNTKMKLAEDVAARAGVSKKSALHIIEKYTGIDPVLHRWKFEVRERGAKVFILLDQPSELPDARV